jgi:hypothetical protein
MLALTEVPEWLAELPDLTFLNLHENQIAEVPDWLGSLGMISELILSRNNLTRLPDALAGLTQLIVPVAAAIDIAALPAPRRDEASARLDVMKSIVDALPPSLLDAADDDFFDSQAPHDRLMKGEGRALRALRQTLFAHDPAHGFGDLRRVQSPAGDLLWVAQVRQGVSGEKGMVHRFLQ